MMKRNEPFYWLSKTTTRFGPGGWLCQIEICVVSYAQQALIVETVASMSSWRIAAWWKARRMALKHAKSLLEYARYPRLADVDLPFQDTDGVVLTRE